MVTPNHHRESEITDFYQHIRDYWEHLSRSPEGKPSWMLNFGFWPDNTKNLHEAQDRLFHEINSLLPDDLRNKNGLEIGCGIGGVSIKALQHHTQLKMTSLDISADQLNIAKKHAIEGGVGARLDPIQGDAMDLPFQEGVFDLTLCIESTFHYENKEKFMAGNFKVLKPGGVAIVADITCENNNEIRFRQGNHFSRAHDYSRIAKEVGFEIDYEKNFGPVVYAPLYAFVTRFNQIHRMRSGKYWSIVLRNYKDLCDQGLMGYHLWRLKKPV
jgi:ubiquinone/menaquinone biosynthesis C-methylase UbiE